ncbi:uncharacterized protein LOC131893469 [Tigriopus californicus]|nr:uncharacterized protein LOC131893469 [Tigriopus californicus]
MLEANNGVLMINFWNNVVRCSKDYKNATIDDVIEDFNYVKDLIGVDHLGMGADYDGVPIVPKGLEDVSKYPDLLEKLVRDHNWSREDIKKITGANILRVMKDVEKVAEELEATKANDDTLDYCRIVGSDNCLIASAKAKS